MSELLNAVAIWVFVGFLFGFAFHRICGGDGITKAMRFGAAIALTFLVSQGIAAKTSGIPLERFAPLLPVLLFLMVLGSLVFDGRSLDKQKVGLSALPEIYGLKTAIGYASFAGIIAAFQPVLQFFDWLFKKDK